MGSSAEAIEAERLRFTRQYQRAQADLWRALFEEWDVVPSPLLSKLAFPPMLGEEQNAERIEIDGREVTFVDQLVWPGVATAVGRPVTVAPVGPAGGGVPKGVQLMGARPTPISPPSLWRA